MIIFDLICSDRHIFEGWFSSSSDYECQLGKNMLICPICGSADVSKSVMAPNIGLKSNQRSNAPTQSMKSDRLSSLSDEDMGPQDTKQNTQQPIKGDNGALKDAPVTFNDEALKIITSALVKAQNEALKKSTWVGDEFAQEARAIHYGETKKRQIHGHTSHNEAVQLQEEGIDIAALPLPFIAPNLKN